jgi:uncharacterized protein (DUF2147 family)
LKSSRVVADFIEASICDTRAIEEGFFASLRMTNVSVSRPSLNLKASGRLDSGGANVKLAITSLLLAAVLCQNACGRMDLHLAPQNPIVGKWRSADGSYVVEFLPTGDCSAGYRMQGREVRGPCTYTVDKDAITIHYYGMNAHPQDSGPDASVIWRYSLAGDNLNVSVQGTSLALQRVQ